MKITTRDARVLHKGITVVTSGTHNVVTTSADDSKSATEVPFLLEDKGRWNLTKNLELCDTLIKRVDKQKMEILRELTGAVGRDLLQAKEPQKYADYIERTEALEDMEHSLPLLRVKRSWLKEGNDNPIPGIVIVSMKSILQDDTTQANKDEIIPD